MANQINDARVRGARRAHRASPAARRRGAPTSCSPRCRARGRTCTCGSATSAACRPTTRTPTQRMVDETLLGTLRADEGPHLHPVRGELEPEDAAWLYGDRARRARWASSRSSTSSCSASARTATPRRCSPATRRRAAEHAPVLPVRDAPKPPPERITLSLPGAARARASRCCSRPARASASRSRRVRAGDDERPGRPPRRRARRDRLRRGRAPASVIVARPPRRDRVGARAPAHRPHRHPAHRAGRGGGRGASRRALAGARRSRSCSPQPAGARASDTAALAGLSTRVADDDLARVGLRRRTRASRREEIRARAPGLVPVARRLPRRRVARPTSRARADRVIARALSRPTATPASSRTRTSCGCSPSAGSSSPSSSARACASARRRSPSSASSASPARCAPGDLGHRLVASQVDAASGRPIASRRGRSRRRRAVHRACAVVPREPARSPSLDERRVSDRLRSRLVGATAACSRRRSAIAVGGGTTAARTLGHGCRELPSRTRWSRQPRTLLR